MPHFMFDAKSPVKALYVRETCSPEAITKLFSVVADYEWCERILCSDCYMDDANSIATILANDLNVEATLVTKWFGNVNEKING